MKKNLFIYLFLIVLVVSCNRPNLDVYGPAFDVLSPSKYNSLQQEYVFLGDFEGGTSRVNKQNLWGLINVRGREILKAEYDTIYSLVHNYRIVKKHNKYGLVDKTGKLVVLCKYDDFKSYIANDSFAFQLNGKWGFVSCEDVIKVQFKYDNLCHVYETVFVGEINGKQGLFDYNDQTIINPEYDRVLYRPYVGSDISYVKKGDKYAIVNSRNEVVTKCEFPFGMPSGDYITMKSYFPKRFCLIHWETGKVLIPYNIYEELGDRVDGVLYACKKGKYGYVNPKNETIIPFKFADAEDFSEGLAMVGIVKGTHNTWWGSTKRVVYGYIDQSGTFVIPPKFANQSLNPGSGFKEELAVMGAERKDNIYPDKYGYIDKTGKWAIKPIYTDAGDFVNGVAVVQTSRGYGAINKSGEWVVEPKYYDYDYRGWHKDSLVFKDKDGQTFEFTLTGEAL